MGYNQIRPDPSIYIASQFSHAMHFSTAGL